MKRLLTTPGFVTVVGALMLAVLAVAGYLIVVAPAEKTVGYCAQLPDAIGLYPGNQVTSLGIPVGTVTTIRPEGTGVRVEFDIDAKHPLHGQPTATTVSDTLVADRSLAVFGEPGAPLWDRGRCLTKTFTPKSISQTLDSFAKVAAQLNGGNTPAQQHRIRDGVNAFRAATADTGPQLNTLITDLATALRQPDAAIGNIGRLIDAFAAIASSISANWDDIARVVLRANDGIGFINELWGRVVQIADSLLVLLPWLNRLANTYGRPLLGALDGAVPGLRLLAANVGSLQQIITMIPPIATAFAKTTDPATGWPRLTYAPPTLTLPQPQADQICAVLDTITPGQCRTAADGLFVTELAPLILGTVGAR
ncbi:MlaD family protein [Nocardia altamirensis]|uniref:MlaD family protein n=1 Tax=Nocardia altamirensis TaxID=472158 RepID=UPI0014354E11|nr:MlaD family protein [Nocardia altamirensis]